MPLPHPPLPPHPPSFAPLGAPFNYVPRQKMPSDVDQVIYLPHLAPAVDLSPQSSVSSVSTDSWPDLFDGFVRTQSRVVRISDAPPVPLLSRILGQNGLVPTSLWGDMTGSCVWALFHSHGEACAALSLSSPRFHVAAALDADLSALKRVDSSPNPMSPQVYMNNLRLPPSVPVHGPSGVSMGPEEYTISSNPPNPRSNFRLGDWICRAQNCAAHNFGRNLTCIGCGCPRSPTTNGTPVDSPHHNHTYNPHHSRPPLSPRFVTAANSMYSPNVSPTAYGFPPHTPPSIGSGRPQPHPQSPVNIPMASTLAALNKAASSGYPLLTPSGRAFAIGGKVQNVSSDPLAPCIMYWPDNEPFPEQGQIRPSNLINTPQPPILNTGNRGPISHQPGDWVCLKCNYLNWRRRKVCQTCLPYAEGNGDSISAAVQAERIALLTSVLAHTSLGAPNAVPSPSPPLPLPQQQPQQPAFLINRSHSATPAQAHRPFVDFSPPPAVRGAVHRSQSHSELGTRFPIYETSPTGVKQFPRSPLQHSSQMPPGSASASAHASPVSASAHLHAPAPAPLLPSFLQDIVQSPTLSPASTSSADLSFDEYEDSLPSSTRSTFSGRGDSPLANIWRLDGEESKSLTAAFPLPTRRERVPGGDNSATSSRNSSVERLRLQQHVS
ncbi:RanBP2-type domain-containing protein [Mycena kentingensis (nom. inval.)]|nr:RanBP2-type domain-containing protein [Mycena kentingensis (nom. inval.)]